MNLQSPQSTLVSRKGTKPSWCGRLDIAERIVVMGGTLLEN
jgi:hypothetical protein